MMHEDTQMNYPQDDKWIDVRKKWNSNQGSKPGLQNIIIIII